MIDLKNLPLAGLLAFSWQPAPNSEKGYSASDGRGMRYDLDAPVVVAESRVDVRALTGSGL